MDIDSVVQNNTGLIGAQMKRLGVLFDPDAESIGYEALWTAAVTYDDTKGYKFSTYATCCIYNALGSYIRTLNRKRQLETLSYNNVAYTEDGAKHEFVDFLPDSADVEKDYLHRELCGKVLELYEHVYNRLTNEKHRAIISAWHEADYDISNKEIALAVGVSQPYVNQVINTFRHSLRKKLEVEYNA